MPDESETVRLHDGAPAPPPCPEHLTGEAARLWRELAPRVVEALSVAALPSLEIAVAAYATWREHTAIVAAEGSTRTTPNGFAQLHPSVGIARAAADTWRKLARQLRLDSPPAVKKIPTRFGAFSRAQKVQ